MEMKAALTVALSMWVVIFGVAAMYPYALLFLADFIQGNLK